MPFKYDFGGDLEENFGGLHKKDRKLYEALMKKIEQIAASYEFTIDHYKNLSHGMSDYKRVHVGKSFVLIFRVFKKERFILFDRFRHHDDAYKR